ncbi:DUF4476 domain-containing protein [Hymenobacter daeguensis]
MKKALLFAIAGLLTAVLPALAYPPAPANANFSSERGVPFGLVLDGRPLTRGMARQVHVDQLVPGLHWADFSVPTAYGGAVRFRSRVWLEPGLETTFVLVARPGRQLYLQQVNAVSLYGGGRGYGYGNGYNNGYGGHYNSPAPYPAPAPGSYGNAPYNGNNPNGSYDNGGYNNAPNGGYNNAPYPNNGGYNAPNNGNNSPYGNNPNTPNGGGYNNGPGNGAGYYPGSAVSSYRTLAPQDVTGLEQTMKQRITEVSKLNAAKDGLKERSIQADDLSRLLHGLSSEACRIDLAKFAYSHVSDPENFDRVYDAFETEAGARAVEDAVNAAPQR